MENQEEFDYEKLAAELGAEIVPSDDEPGKFVENQSD